MTEKHLQLMRRALLFVGTLAIFTFTALHAQAGKHLVTWVDGRLLRASKNPSPKALAKPSSSWPMVARFRPTLNFGDRIQLEQTLPACLQGPCSLSLSAPVGAIWALTTHPEGDRIRVTLTHLPTTGTLTQASAIAQAEDWAMDEAGQALTRRIAR